MQKVTSAAATLMLMAALVSTLAAQAGKVSGTLVVNAKKFALQHISAVSYDTAQGRMISVLLSDKPADPKTFREYTRIGPGERYVPGLVTGAWVAMHSDDKAFSGLHFTIDSKQRAMLTEALVGTTRDGDFGILEDYLTYELTSIKPRLVGRVRTKDPVTDLGSQKVGIDLTFDTAVAEIGK